MKHSSLAVALLCLATAARAQSGSSTGQLVITSTPTGADISVDGKPMGKAPLTARGVMPGDHFVEASWSDGKTASSMQHVEAGASLNVMLGVPLGSLVVISQPAGAELIIDGKFAGKAPTTAGDLPAGNHQVTARWPNGASLTNIARVVAGNSSVLMLRMPASPVPPPAGAPPPVAVPVPPAAPPPVAAPPPPVAAPPPATAPPPPAETAPPVAVPPPAPAPPPPTETAPPPVAAPPPAAAPPPVVSTTTTAPAGEAPTPVYKKAWLWVVVGVVVVGVAVGVGVGVGVKGGNSRYGIAEF